MFQPPQPPVEMTTEEFEFFRSHIHARAGISMNQSKINLVASRLSARLTQLRLKSFKDYQSLLNSLSDSDPEWQLFINCLTTNKTDWFREPEHFKFLSESFLPEWKKSKGEKLRIWCAASSTGEEPYSLSLHFTRLFAEHFKDGKTDFEILATDIDTNVLAVAKNGVYPISSLVQIPAEYHPLGIARGKNDLSDWFKIKDLVREKVRFQALNLMAGDKNLKEHFDLILCRNVLIYFDPLGIETVAKKLFDSAAPDSVLLIGHSETLQNISSPWKFLKPSVYARGRYASLKASLTNKAS